MLHAQRRHRCPSHGTQCASLLSCSAVSDSATPWTVAHQAPWDSPGKNTGVGCYALLQGISQTQGSNSRPLHCQADSLPLSLLGSPLGIWNTLFRDKSTSWELHSIQSISSPRTVLTSTISERVWSDGCGT